MRFSIPSNFLILILGVMLLACPSAMGAGAVPESTFPRAIDTYGDAEASLGGKLLGRIRQEPFNLVASLLFVAAVFHTFMTARFNRVAHDYEHRLQSLAGDERGLLRDRLQFRSRLFHFLGEIEAVFGIWLVPLGILIITVKGWPAFTHYVSQTSFAEPIFVVVVMAMASSRPVLRFAEACLARVSALGGGGPTAWWLAVLTLGPILGSFITEPAAMTICALILSRKFYALNPPMSLRYATLGLLFVNISVGGTLTHFAAPPVVMVAGKWGWGLTHMFTEFGWKAVLGILLANALYFIKFRTQLATLQPDEDQREAGHPVPASVVVVHLLFIAWAVFTAHYPPLVVMGLLFFMAYVEATRHHQQPLTLRGPMLVGFFLAALVVHGGCQQWWIAPVLGSLGKWPLMIGSTVLTALNDNAAITYLATLVPNFSPEMKYAVVVGAVTGGGLTVIANAPNPAGLSILQKHFGPDGVSPVGLLLAALVPTVIMGAALMLL